MTRDKTHPFQMRVSAEWLGTLDDWRRQQPDLPSRAEAIRRLVERGMDLNVAEYAPGQRGKRVFHQDAISKG